MTEIQNWLKFINDNWLAIVVGIALISMIVSKVKSILAANKETRIETIKKQISEIILKLVSDAENEYDYLSKSGFIKRSQVVKEIFDKYPLLEKVSNQNDILNWIDFMIDRALKELRDVIAINCSPNISVDNENDFNEEE